MGGIKSFENAGEMLIQRGPGGVNPFAIPMIISIWPAPVAIRSGHEARASSP